MIGIYSKNKYVEKNVITYYENTCTDLNSLSSIAFNFDDGNTLVYTNVGGDFESSVPKNFPVQYTSTGLKTVSLTSVDKDTGTASEWLFPGVRCVNAYEYIEPTYYASELSQLDLKYSGAEIAPNEIIIADNVNAACKKIYDTVEYLRNRSIIYLPEAEFVAWTTPEAVSFNHMLTATVPVSLDSVPTSVPILSSDVVGIETVENSTVLCTSTALYAISADEALTLLATPLTGFDSFYQFQDIKNIARNSEGDIYLLDSVLNRVGVYSLSAGVFTLLYDWGTFGGPSAKRAFNAPNDLHVDRDDYVYVADTGNKCVKAFSNSGSWVNTYYLDEAPISVAVDSQSQIHVLLSSKVVVLNRDGTTAFEYPLMSEGAQRIDSNYVREVFYVVYPTKIEKYFRTGAYMGLLFEERSRLKNLKAVSQDSFRNLTVSNNGTLMYFVDRMMVQRNCGEISPLYWSMNDIYVHKNEYVQNWVYNKCFSRLYDCVEMLRNSLFFDDSTICKKYVPAIYTKEQCLINQNEMVYSVVVNKALGNIWANLMTLIPYFDPHCIK